MADSITWDARLPKREFGRVFNIKLHKNSATSHKVNIILTSDGDKPAELAESLLSKRVITVQNSTRLPAGQTEEEFAAKCAKLNGSKYPLVPTGGAIVREPTTDEAIDILSRAIDNGTLTRETVSPALLKKCEELGIELPK